MAQQRPPASRDHHTNEDGALDTPLHRLPAFDTGLRRQRIAFVKAGETLSSPASSPACAVPSDNVAAVYLGIVLGGAAAAQTDENAATPRPQSAPPGLAASSPPAFFCEACRLPLPSSSPAAVADHESSLVHQVALGHSKPPSALDRSRFGLAVMAAQGWDPDSGLGLGRDQQGMPYPIRARARPDRQALGADAPRDGDIASPSSSATVPSTAAGVPQNSRKHRRKMEEDRRRRHDRLREQIMGNRDLDKYLRPEG